MGQVRTYFIAPNFDIHPPPDGPIRLGHIITAPDDPTLDPINHLDYIPAPGVHPVSYKEGFSSTIKKLLNGDLGFWAQVAGIVGLNMSGGFNKSADQEITIKELETISFSPTRLYVESILKLPEVEEYITASKYKVPVYMVTGLKIARSASLRAGSEQSFQGTAAIEMPADTARIGPEARLARTNIRQESFERSSDFVLAFRVQRIRFQKVGPDVYIRDVKLTQKERRCWATPLEHLLLRISSLVLKKMSSRAPTSTMKLMNTRRIGRVLSAPRGMWTTTMSNAMLCILANNSQ